MNKFLEKVHKQIMESISEYAPDAGILTVDFAIDNSIGGMLYRLKSKDRAKHITILAISSDVKMSDSIARMVYPLIDSVVAKKNRLIIIHCNSSSKQGNDIYTFLSEEADIFHPDYLRLSTTLKNLQTTINGEKYTGLNNILRKYFSGEIVFVGPTARKQSVNIEVYKGICRICESKIAVVSGIVFPKIQMPQWDNPFWQYYNTLIPLYWLPSEYSKQIKREIERLRNTDSGITPLIYYQDVKIEESDWTVMCPHCKAVISKMEPDNKRMNCLVDFDGRMNGNLRYYPIFVDVSQELINLLDKREEFGAHVCYGGWVEVESKIVEP